MKENEYSHMSMIGYTKDNKDQWTCNGVLISENVILGSAHCNLVNSPTIAILGDSTKHIISEIINYPEFNPSVKRDDISLYRLKSPVNISRYTKPICLPKRKKNYGSNFVLTSLKTAKNINGKIELKLEANSNVHEKKNCSINFDVENQLCVGDFSSADGIIQIKSSDSSYTIVGLSSHGHDVLSDKPSASDQTASTIYTKVSSYRNWIECKVWNECDKKVITDMLVVNSAI